jgi:hypothetical protein
MCSKPSSKQPKKISIQSSLLNSRTNLEESVEGWTRNNESLGAGQFEYDMRVMNYPKPVNRFIQKFDSSNQWGSFYYMFIILLSFVRFSQLLAKEKQHQLRKGLIPLGLNHFAYWFSWLICIALFDIVFTCLIVFGGMAFGFPMFKEIVFILPFLVVLLCLWSYRFLSVLITSFCDNYRSATKANYTILVISIFLQSKCIFIFNFIPNYVNKIVFFCNQGISNLFWISKRPFIINILNVVFFFFPSYSFSIIINNMQYNVGYHLDPTTFVWEKGPGYTFADFMKSINNVNPQMQISIKRPSDFFFMMCFLVLIVIYIVVIYLADHLFESNRGHPHNPFKFLTKMFSKSKNKNNGEIENNEELESNGNIILSVFLIHKNKTTISLKSRIWISLINSTS